MENFQSDNNESVAPEQQAKLLSTARRILARWADTLGKEVESHDQASLDLAEKILALSVDVNSSFEGENIDDVSGVSIEALNSSVKLRNGLKRASINTVGDLLPLNYLEIAKRAGSAGVVLSKSEIKELKTKLGALGITLPEK